MDEIIRFNGQPSFSLEVEVEEFTYTIEVGRDENRGGAFQVTAESLRLSSREDIFDPIRMLETLSIICRPGRRETASAHGKGAFRKAGVRSDN